MKRGKQKIFYVYRLEAFGSYYYGFTTNLETRIWGHCKSVRTLLQIGNFECTPKETKKLRFHHFVARSMRNKHLFMKDISSNMRMIIVYSSAFEKDAIDVESFLIIKSKSDRRCYNDKIHFKTVK